MSFELVSNLRNTMDVVNVKKFKSKEMKKLIAY